MNSFIRAAGGASLFALIAACGGSEPADTPPVEIDAPAAPDIVDVVEVEPELPAVTVVSVVATSEDGPSLRSTSVVTVSKETTDEGSYFVLSGTDSTVGTGGGTGGAHLVTGEAFEASASGKTVRVTVTARAPVEGQIWVAYSTNDTGNSGWRPFDVTTEFTDIVMEYDVPEMSAGGNDFIGIVGSPESGTDTLHVSSVVAEIISGE